MKTRDEFVSALKQKTPKKPTTPAANLKIMIRDAVHAEYVTNDDHWDRFLSLLQAGANRTADAVKRTELVLMDPRVVNHEDLLATKIEMARFEGMQKSINWIMKLPKALMATGDSARELLPEAEKVEEDASTD